MELPITPSFDEFVSRCAQGNVIPIWTDVVCDLDTPVSAFLKVARHSPNHFLLESVEGGEKWGRYSFIGVDPPVVLRYLNGALEITKNGRVETREHPDPLEAIREFLAPYRPVVDPRLPRFSGGIVGYLSYDAVRYIEQLPSENPSTEQPIAAFMLADVMLILDHFAQTGRVVCNVHVGDGEDLQLLYQRASERIARLVDWLRQPLPTTRPFATAPSAADPDLVEVESNVDRETYEEMVRRGKAYIAAGDAFQIVLSQRFRVPNRGFDLPLLYRTLRLINPSPYMFYLRFGDDQVIGASPEVMVRLEEGLVEVRPIAGTRPRGATGPEDEAIADELRADPKEVAEHIMLVDLGRNDVGRVATIGSVEVSEQMIVERYSHVMHLVSNVRGRTRPGVDAIDVIRATFPAGTLSGAPKIRAMEIIEELEPTRRGVYGGAVGYLGFGGNMDLCIAIRTLTASRDFITVQAGAGIVYDSVPAREYDECHNKAKALLRALAVAKSE
ncbi:MAG: anthranilate synthase component I [Myxococcales bacterium]|nr:anthranilate synthase component I [Myxococcales bacterium]